MELDPVMMRLYPCLNLLTVLRSTSLQLKVPFQFSGSRSLGTSASLTYAAYTFEEKQYILTKLNDINDNTRKLLGEKCTKNIHQYLKKNGSFSNLEDLLKVTGIGPKTLCTVCQKVLQTGDIPVTKSQGVKKKTFSTDIPLSFLAAVKNLTAVYIDGRSVSWSKIDCQTKYLIDWNIKQLAGIKNHSLRECYAQAKIIEESIPDSDLYVLEDPSKIYYPKQNQPVSTYLLCILTTLLYATREKENEIKVASVKPRMVEQYFNSIVGAESISLQHVIEDMLEQNTNMSHSNLYISPQLKNYFIEQIPYHREQLTRACLTGVCFLDCFILQRKRKDS